MTALRRLARPVDPARDHVLGDPSAEMTLVEYGGYTSPGSRAAREVVAELRGRFGARLRFVFRHLPGRSEDRRAAELAEYVAEKTGRFWPVHDALGRAGPALDERELERIAVQFGVTAPDERDPTWERARRRVAEDLADAAAAGVRMSPTFFVGRRRYEGPWDATTLAEALLGSVGHRLHLAALDFVRWGPSAGVLLLVASIVAVVLTNSPVGATLAEWWRTPFALSLGPGSFALTLHEWINHALLTVFFLVVGLEIKREFTVGRLSTRRAAALPVAAAVGGMIAPALLYVLVVPDGPLERGWGVPIATDTAFALAVLGLLGGRVPVELRVFLTAAVIVDDLVAIAVVALFYATAIHLPALAGAVGVAAALAAINRLGVYRPLPYVVLGVVLWVLLHESGVHATLAGVLVALVTPTRPPASVGPLLAHADAIFAEDLHLDREEVLRRGPSEGAMRALDAIHDRIESPADKLLRSLTPWASYVVLPVFALANAGVVVSTDAVRGHGALILAIVLGLVVGKPLGIGALALLAVRVGLASKPEAYSWRQLCGAGVLAGVGFTMSLFIAEQAYPDPAEFAAAKIAVFVASILASALGYGLLRIPAPAPETSPRVQDT